MDRGLFITFEGGEGSGKSTQILLLSEALGKSGYSIITTREPGGTFLGQEIRKLLLSEKSIDMDPKTELLLYTADRRQHIHEVVHPALAEGKIVLSDRYQDSTTVYQGIARGLEAAWIQTCRQLATEGLNPHLTFLLDISPELGLERSKYRLKNESKDEGRFEKEALIFHQKVREGFLKLAQQEPKRFYVLDASEDVESLHQKILNKVMLTIQKSTP